MELSQARRLLRMNTPLGRDKLYVANLAAEETISELFRFSVAAFSEGAPISQEALLGEPLVVSVAASAEPQRHFHGLVESVMLRSVDETRSRFHYEIVCVPWLWHLTRHQDCRIFQNKSVVAIAEEIFGEFGFHDFRWKLKEQPPARSYCVQYRETSFAFLSRLFEEEGIFYFFEHTEERHVMVIGDSDLAYGTLGAGPLAYRRLDMTDSEDGLSDWRSERRLHPASTELGDYNFETPRDELRVRTDTLHAAESRSGMQIYDYPGRYTDRGRGDSLARRRMEAVEVPGHTATARGNVIGLGAGTEFTLTGHPDRAVDGTYLAIGVRHDGSSNWDAGQSGGAGYSQVLRAMPAGRAFRPPRRTPKPVVEGPQTAVVVGRSGEEIDVDEYGRITVQFHWDRRARGNDGDSCRIRVAQSWVGMRWGAMVLPRVGMEVIVEFLEGDPDRPLVTGCVVNADNMPPYSLPAERTKTTFRTNSTPDGGGFNEVRFEDKKGQEQIFLRAERDLHLRVLNEARELVSGDHHRRVDKNSFNLVKEDRHWTVEGDANEEIEGNRSDTVGEVHHLKVGQDWLAKAGGEIVIEAGSRITLKVGGSFIAISPSGIAIQGPMVRINSGGSAGGQSASPEAPEPPARPVDSKAGETGEPPKARQLQPAQPDEAAVRQIEAIRGAAASAAALIQNCR